MTMNDTKAYYNPDTKQLRVCPSAIVVERGGREILRVDANYDLVNLGQEEVDLFISRWSWLCQCVTLHWPGPADFKRMEEHSAALAKYQALPWYRRLFTFRP